MSSSFLHDSDANMNVCQVAEILLEFIDDGRLELRLYRNIGTNWLEVEFPQVVTQCSRRSNAEKKNEQL